MSGKTGNNGNTNVVEPEAKPISGDELLAATDALIAKGAAEKAARKAPQRKGGIQPWNKTVTFEDLKALANAFLAGDQCKTRDERRGIIRFMDSALASALQNGGTEFLTEPTENEDGSVTYADVTRRRYL